MRWAKAAILFVSIILADQLSKWFVGENVLAGSGKPFLDWLVTSPQDRLTFLSTPALPFLDFVVVWNEGVSFGFLKTGHEQQALILTIFTSLIALAFFIGLFFTKRNVSFYCFVLVIAGALGNIWDRVRFGAVYDFIDFHIGNWHYPAFNIADSAIVIAVAILLFDNIMTSRKPKT
ncbi:MAG: signal peptidase II [Alphaproteobacteria bacterium]|nr:signal peptidase II [Alphaproteobacteria bacterium]